LDKVDAENAKKRLEDIKGDDVATEEPAIPLQSSSTFQLPTMFNIVSFLIVILLCICLNLCFSLKEEQLITNAKMESLATQLDRIESLLS
jgi:predicted LPLAT superfamily acyltransferase